MSTSKLNCNKLLQLVVRLFVKMVLERFPYDVLRHIFSFLQQHNLGTLSALARTSHSIHELAVDLLWENQQALWPLVLLLPSFVIERASLANQKLSSSATFLTHALHCSTWDRALHYGSRVRRVCFSGAFRMAHYKLLAECPSPLLPNLAHLEVHASHEAESDLLSCFRLLVDGSQGLQSRLPHSKVLYAGASSHLFHNLLYWCR